jgi:hypothetical protein
VEVDDSVVMEGSIVSAERELVRRMIEWGFSALSANGLSPNGERLLVGESTTPRV